MTPRKICIVTGTRAEYGLLYWLMREVENDPDLTLQLIVTGTHLEEHFGNTVDVIEADGFNIDAYVPIDLSDDAPAAIARSSGLATEGIAEALENLRPDILVILGDRFEMLAAATAATICTVPIAHIHGGEITEGAIDDAMRHAITKLSVLHFVAAEDYKRRVIQMGAHPETVFTVGAPGLDHLERKDLLSSDFTRNALNLEANASYFLITLHPTTRSDVNPESEIDALLDSLTAFPDHVAIFTGVNADAGRDKISSRIDTYVETNRIKAHQFESLGQVKYLSAMKHAALVIGNSSSGIIEAPAVGVPTVNIGDRQKGRLRADSIIDCAGNASKIQDAISKGLNPAFRESFAGMKCPYGMPGASVKIAKSLKGFELGVNTYTSFYDLPQAGAI